MEFHYPLEIARLILSRETVRKDVTHQSQTVWEKRLAFADLKRKFPTLNDKLDDELLVDKERPVKKLDSGYARLSSLMSYHSALVAVSLVSRSRRTNSVDIARNLSYDRRTGSLSFANKSNRHWSDRRPLTIIGKTW